MGAIEFTSVIEGNIIHIPEQYKNVTGNTARVIITVSEETAPKRKVFGSEDFTELKIRTRGWKFDRDEANERG
jgi:hypothetical protein